MGKILVITAIVFITAFLISCARREVPYLPGMGNAPTPVATLTK